ncbi:MAG: tripartite tricarboxylate transporter substrate binding protein, partial [Gemmatimonadetes bacterium]|nr:tripartite tricarboxylate transporter substrate binding protein [Gemmatimonadota bacterium]
AVGCGGSSDSVRYECVAPANPGGGWDLACRLAARAFTELGLVSENVRVTNLPGAGGGRAYVKAATSRSRDTGAFFTASPATTLNLAQGLFGSLDVHDVRWVAAVAAEAGVITVRSDAPWENLADLVADWRNDPGSVVVAGGSAVGSQDHVKVLLLAEAVGVDPRTVRYVPFDGGGEAVAALLGGFVNLHSGEASEVLPHLESGSARVLSVLSRARLSPPLDHLPTTFEAGIDVEWMTWRGFYLPGEVSDSVYDDWAERFTALAGSDHWAEVRAQYRLEPFFMAGSEFTDYVEEQVGAFRSLAERIGLVR